MTISKNVIVKDAFNDDVLKKEYMDISGCTDENESVQRNRKSRYLILYPENNKLDLKGINYLLRNDGELSIIVKSGINEIEISNLELIKDCRELQICDETGLSITVNYPDANSIHFNNIEHLDIIATFKVFADKIHNLYTTPEGLANINIKEVDNLDIHLTEDELQNEVNLDFENIEIVSDLYLRALGNSTLKCNLFLRFQSNSELRIAEINLCFYVQDTFYLVADDVLDIQTNQLFYYEDNSSCIYFINIKVSNLLIKQLDRKGHEVFII